MSLLGLKSHGCLCLPEIAVVQKTSGFLLSGTGFVQRLSALGSQTFTQLLIPLIKLLGIFIFANVAVESSQ